MNLKEKYYDWKGFKRESTLESMKVNPELKIGNIVSIAETGYFYDIKSTSTAIPLNNGLFASVKRSTFLQLVTTWIDKLNNHIPHMASTTEPGHMSAEDKTKLDNLIPNNGTFGKVLVNNGNGTSKWDNEIPVLKVTQTFMVSGYEIGVEP